MKPQAVWLQFARLLLAGAAPQLRRGLRTLLGAFFALRAYVAFAVLRHAADALGIQFNADDPETVRFFQEQETNLERRSRDIDATTTC